MAVAVISGLITSTVLSLLVIPAVFTLVDDIERQLGLEGGVRGLSAGATGAAKPGLTQWEGCGCRCFHWMAKLP